MSPSPRARPAATACPFGVTLAVLAALAAACAPGTGPDAPTTPDAAAAAGSGANAPRLVMSPAAAVLVRDLRDPAEVGPRDPVRIVDARVHGDSLRVAVETGGGCRRHTFRLAIAQGFLESDPVQVRAALGHDAQGDPCRALLRGELAASLRPLAEAWRRDYRAQRGTVIIHLDGWSTALRYSF